jgi:hypothetical protein
LKHRFIEFTKVAFCDIQKADNEISGPFDNLNHHFLNRGEVAFLVVFCRGQKAENDFSVLLNPLIHGFIDFTAVAFCDI